MNSSVSDGFLESGLKIFKYYKSLGDKAFQQVNDEDLFIQYSPQSNSIAIIVQHMSGNMLSRFTNFLTDDGEKSWRDRDAEFTPRIENRKELLKIWEDGWNCLFNAVENLNDSDLQKIVYVRNEGHTVSDAICRQLTHYSYHVGQIVFAAKMFSSQWKSLTIPLNQSSLYNQKKFQKEKRIQHFTDDMPK